VLACTCHCQLPRSPCAPLATTHNPLLYAVPFITDTKKFEHEDRPSLDCSGTRLKHRLAGRELRGLQVLDICKFQFLKSEIKIEILQLFITAVQNFIMESCSWDRILMLLLLIRSGVCSGLFSFVGNIYVSVGRGKCHTIIVVGPRNSKAFNGSRSLHVLKSSKKHHWISSHPAACLTDQYTKLKPAVKL